MTQRKKRTPIKPRRHTNKVGNESPKDKEFYQIADIKKTQNQIKSKNASYSQNEDMSSMTALLGSKLSDELEGSQSPSISFKAQNNFDDAYKRAVSVVRKKEQETVDSLRFRPLLLEKSFVQDYSLNLIRRTLFSFGESRLWDPLFEVRGTDYPNPIVNTIIFWQKNLDNWSRICKDFNDYTSSMFMEFWIKPFWVIWRGERADYDH